MALVMMAVSCDKTAKEHFQIGETLPEFSVTTLDGENLSTASLKGKPSIVVLFTSTCPDCHKQLPEIEEVFANHKADINVLAISRGEDAKTVEAFWEDRGFTMPVAAPGDRVIYDLFDRGSATGVPQVYISNLKGEIIGFTNDKKVLTADEILTIFHDKGPVEGE